MTASLPPELSPDIAAQCLRFVHLDQRRVLSTAAISPRVAQLAVSFPLLFSVLTYPYGPCTPRGDAINAVVAGASLRKVAEIIGLPYCFRNIQPEACPENLHYHHWNPDADRQLRSLIPEDSAVTYPWLITLFITAERGDEAVAIWMARQRCLVVLARLHFDALQPLLMFAWYSLYYPEIVHPEGKWTPALSLRRALKRCELWLKHLALFTELDVKGVVDPWLPETHESGVHIVPITTPQAILEEASAMANCLVDYGEYVAAGDCRLFSVRSQGQRVATMRLDLCQDGQSLVVSEIKGPGNQPCLLNIRSRVMAIVSAYQPRRFSTDFCRPVSERLALSKCLEPYIRTRPKGEHEWLAEISIASLYADHAQMARLARITTATSP